MIFHNIQDTLNQWYERNGTEVSTRTPKQNKILEDLNFMLFLIITLETFMSRYDNYWIASTQLVNSVKKQMPEHEKDVRRYLHYLYTLKGLDSVDIMDIAEIRNGLYGKG